MKPFLFALALLLVPGLPQWAVGQTTKTAALPQGRYLALDVNGMGGFHRYRYLEGDEIRFRSGGDVYRATLVAVDDSSFSVSLRNEVMDRMEAIPFRFADVQRIYRRKEIPFISQLGVILPIAGTVYTLADFVNPKSLDGRTGRFRYDPQTLIPAGSMIVAGAIFYKLTRPSYRVGKKNRLRAF